MGLDGLERRFSFAGAAIALVISVFFIPRLLHNTTMTVTAATLKNGKCASGYSLVKSVCSKSEITHPSYWIIQFAYVVVVGAAIGVFAYYRKRPGVIVAAFMLGLASGIVGTGGIAFLALGAWLAVRAFRLQKYGDPTFRGSNVKARERAQERRANRGAHSKTAKSSVTTSATGTTRATPPPSKRYTPKKTNRR